MWRRLWLYLPELCSLLIALAAQIQLVRWLYKNPERKGATAARNALWAAGFVLCLWIAFGFVFSIPRFGRLLAPSWWLTWARGAALAWAVAAVGAFALTLIWRRLPKFNAERRGFLRATGAIAAGAPFATLGFGIFVQRLDLRAREIEIPIARLPQDLEGLRIVQLSDIHLSPFLSERDLERAVGMANEFRAHLAVVTGDLITSQNDPLDAALKQLARLRAEAGILGCHGNHEIYARAEEYATREGARLGIRFLRRGSAQLRFGAATLNVAGVDHQPMGTRYLRGAEKLVAPGVVNVLLSHNPDVFPAAAGLGFDLTVAGHTHGGQVTFEILHQTVNLARWWTPYVYGLYRANGASIYVSRGIGTVGIPARVGAPPEVVLLRLRSASGHTLRGS